MSQAFLFVPIHLVGVLIALAGGLRDRPILASTVGFPLGLAAFVPVLLGATIVTLPVGFFSVGLALLIPALVAYLVIRRDGGPSGKGWLAISLYVVAFGLTTVAVAKFLDAAMTFDSHAFVIQGRTLANEGLSPAVLGQLRSWGVFVVVEQSLVAVLPNDYLYAIAPTLAASFTATFAAILWHALPIEARERKVISVGFVALVVVSLSTIFMYGYNFIYIHTNFGSAVYLFLFVALLWMAETQSRPKLVPLAFVALLAFCLHRVETPAIACLFMVLTLPYTSRTSISRVRINRPLWAMTLLICGWYIYLAFRMTDEAGEFFLTRTRVAIVVAGLVGVCGFWALCESPLLKKFNKHLPRLLIAALVLALIVAFATKLGHMMLSTEHVAWNLFLGPFWGWAWWGILVLAALTIAMRPVPFSRVYRFGLPLYAGMIILLAYPRIPYRVTFGDSANRMMIHIVPLAFFYFGIVFGGALASRNDAKIPATRSVQDASGRPDRK